MFLAPARSALDVVKVQFTGKLTYNNKGELYIDGAGDPEYFGQPSPAIDEAWMDLIGRMILVFLPFFFESCITWDFQPSTLKSMQKKRLHLEGHTAILKMGSNLCIPFSSPHVCDGKITKPNCLAQMCFTVSTVW